MLLFSPVELLFAVGYTGLIAGILVIAIILIQGKRRALSVELEAFPGLREARLRARLMRLLGLALGGIAAVSLVSVDLNVHALGRLAIVAPAMWAGFVIAGQFMAEKVSRSVAVVPGCASLDRRCIRDVIPRGTTVATGVLGACLMGLFVWAGCVHTAGDSRSFTSVSIVNGEITSQTSGPFPGPFYSLPQIGALAIVTVLAIVALRRIVARGRNGADPRLVLVDDALRRQSAGAVVSAVGAAYSACLAGSAFYAAISVSRHSIGEWAVPILAILVASGLLGLVVMVAGILVAPSGLPASESVTQYQVPA